MSFGSSVSDVVVLGELAYKVVEAVRNAGSDYQELTRELERYHLLHSMHTIRCSLEPY